MIFQDKKDLLSLYNAVNQSHYENPEELEITTLDNVLYMGMKNDLSFLVDSILNLYEAQSTWNPNMPLRGLAYFSRMYSGYVASRKLDIYSKTRIPLPEPRYLVFYNGTKDEPELLELRLSDSFIKKPAREKKAPCLECIATVININWGHNQELMAQCRRLYEYAFLIDQIRKGLAGGLTLEGAIDQGIGVCLKEGILTEFLTRHQGEVKTMILTEYDEALHLENTYQSGFSDGKAQGIEIGEKAGEIRLNQLYQYLSSHNRMEDLKRALTDEDFRQKLMEEYQSG